MLFLLVLLVVIKASLGCLPEAERVEQVTLGSITGGVLPLAVIVLVLVLLVFVFVL